MNILFLIFLSFILVMFLESLFYKPKKLITLHILIDKDDRILYTGNYDDCFNKRSGDLKIVKLTGEI